MDGVDISAWQSGIDPSEIDADFVIIKATEGTTYTNPYWREWAEATLASGKLLGFYHYADGGDVIAEAKYFCDTVEEYKGRAIMVLDWESENNCQFESHSAWTDPWLEYVQDRLGCTPLLYVMQSRLDCYDWPHLWVAQYADYDISYYQLFPWNEGAYDCLIRQYKGSGGRVNGYGGDIDLNKAYIDRDEWMRLAGARMEACDVEYVQDPRIDAFCESMRHWCCEMDMHYSQANRQNFTHGGSMDCSSVTIHCLNDSGFDTGDATYTGNMSDELTKRGWMRVENDGNPQRGDILLNDVHHVGIWDGDNCIEFGGDPHDGYDTCHAYYDYPWDCYLRYPLIEKTKEDDMSNYTKYRAIEEMVRGYYKALLHREADFGGCMCHVDTAIAGDLIDAARAIMGSEEYQEARLDGWTRVDDLYKAFLGREASEPEQKAWIDGTDGDLYAVADGVYGSEEARAYRAGFGL